MEQRTIKDSKFYNYDALNEKHMALLYGLILIYKACVRLKQISNIQYETACGNLQVT